MYGIEKRLLMRQLLEHGLSKTVVARRLGISRRTLYNWIDEGELERDPEDRELQYGPRPPRPSILDPYKARIDARLAECPGLSVVRLLEEVRAAGYPGSYGSVKRYVRAVRPTLRGIAEGSKD
ncbi:MAG: helix-turn-helix domain-containing protein [Gemmatimonadota bacterium]|nr:helix-turn-helix domain-containing protein [Gemmatimonadota bacterium]